MSASALAFIAAALGVAGAAQLLATLRWPFSPHDHALPLKFVAAIPCAALGVAAATVVPGRLGALMVIGAPGIGLVAPDLLRARRVRVRVRAARRDLPPVLDLLRVAIEGGVPLRGALAAVAERSRTRLGAELGVAAGQAGLGVPLSDALSELARRLPAPEVEAFVAALQRALHHGAPLADTLTAQARDARAARRRRIEEEAARAAPKIQLVVALLLVPSVLLMVAAGLVAALLAP
jgi:tight adherence protein C